MQFATSWEKEGYQKGLREGRREGVFEVALQALQSGVPIEQVAQFSGLSLDELKRASRGK
ncbi:MAG: hypothetical protein KF760_30165 [Candidatus Eremiobacteraeota bacterium]|nr:hypothetical protein [Candidatus Eremiobacteraeota bacterium]MCW5872784.1 hypothetical protein [Candidatus Eremiobacteraeota bacterium]